MIMIIMIIIIIIIIIIITILFRREDAPTRSIMLYLISSWHLNQALL